MNIEEIRELASMMSEHKLTSIEIVTEGQQIRLQAQVNPAPVTAVVQVPTQVAPVEGVAAPVPPASKNDFNNLRTITSPLVGVFYRKSSPDSAPFVKVGDRIQKGDTLCIVEAMKMMNEITADKDGEIADICVEDGQVVEFGQTLFKLF